MLNKCIEGLHKGELSLLASRPGVGKTSLALNLSQHLEKQGNKILYIQLEKKMMNLDSVRSIISQTDADALAKKLIAAELTMDKEKIALFDSFNGVVRGAHQAGHDVHAKHDTHAEHNDAHGGHDKNHEGHSSHQ